MLTASPGPVKNMEAKGTKINSRRPIAVTRRAMATAEDQVRKRAAEVNDREDRDPKVKRVSRREAVVRHIFEEPRISRGRPSKIPISSVYGETEGLNFI